MTDDQRTPDVVRELALDTLASAVRFGNYGTDRASAQGDVLAAAGDAYARIYAADVARGILPTQPGGPRV